MFGSVVLLVIVIGIVALVVVAKRRGWVVENAEGAIENARAEAHNFDRFPDAGGM